ncbi:Gp49 family protein [Escherichia coli]|uniref:Gp49 family protein n=1 Tax=Escherichia coli TaxID=562 RepID=UPI000DA52F03|nr:Gp49 family protein [Escherichia coli]EEW8730769.1 hypothetical protein [Escherichia coli]EFT2865265.1 hypothetical protein [Escherichia coli]EFT3131502.1 hypothetical protein [Escherichia coli]SQM45614.1 phage protein [Escherichia coli]HBB0806854.1 hypothetical protein [Escherichia coli]
MNDQQIEKEIVEKGKTAPRITTQHIEDVIKSEHYFTAYDGRNGAISSNEYCGREKPEEGDRDLSPLKLLTFCVLVLKNGFTVTGESACASQENFDAEIGRKIARQNAVNKIWMLEGYLLKQKLSEQ